MLHRALVLWPTLIGQFSECGCCKALIPTSELICYSFVKQMYEDADTDFGHALFCEICVRDNHPALSRA